MYDASLNDAATLASAGVIGGDTVVFSGTSSTFADKNVANGKTVSVVGISASGTDAGNYTLNNASATTTANITPLAITVAATGVNKVYDASLNDAATLASAGVIGGDTVVFSDTSSTFADKNVANGKTVSVAGISASGADAGNYTFNTTALTTANIAPLAITVAATGVNKVYDASLNDAATLASAGVIGGDMVVFSGTSSTFADKNVANGKTVSVAGISASGTDAGNYTLNNATATTTANITPLAITVAATGVNKVYDGSLNATATLASTGVIGGDTVVFSDTSSTFADKNVANGKTVSVLGILASGTDAANYTLNNAMATTTANITQLGSVTWTGPAIGGSWSNPANWAGGAIPDLSNVANVVIPNGSNVTFDSTVAGPVNLNQLSSGGLTVNSGTLNIATGLSLQNYNQTGGSVAGTGSFAVTNAFAQTNGTLSMGRSIAITQVAGPVVLGNITAGGALTVIAPGNISQGADTALLASGPSTFNSTNGGINLGNNGNALTGVVTANGNGITLNNSTTPLDIVLTDAGASSLTTTGSLIVSGSENGLTTNAGATSFGTDTDTGNLTTKSTGPINLGTLTVGGNLLVNSGNSNVTATGPLKVAGSTDIASGAGSITLVNAGNTFGGSVTTSGYSTYITGTGVPAAVIVPLVPIVPVQTSTPTFTIPPVLAMPTTSVVTSVGTNAGTGTATAPGVQLQLVALGDISSSNAADSSAIIGAGVTGGFVSVKTFDSMSVSVGSTFSFTLPADTFKYSDAKVAVVVEAKLLNGEPIPSWLTFDTSTLRFSGTPPKGQENLEIALIARDSSGGEARTKVQLNFTGTK